MTLDRTWIASRAEITYPTDLPGRGSGRRPPGRATAARWLATARGLAVRHRHYQYFTVIRRISANLNLGAPTCPSDRVRLKATASLSDRGPPGLDSAASARARYNLKFLNTEVERASAIAGPLMLA